MQRSQLEHIIRAAAGITGAREFVIVGSQALLGQFPEAPSRLLVSIEADLFTLRDPADADLIDGSIGEGSPFHQTFGYYAHWGIGGNRGAAYAAAIMATRFVAAEIPFGRNTFQRLSLWSTCMTMLASPGGKSTGSPISRKSGPNCTTGRLRSPTSSRMFTRAECPP